MTTDVKRPAGYLLLLSPSLRILKIAFCHGELGEDVSGPVATTPVVGVVLKVVVSRAPGLITLFVDGGLAGLPNRHLWSLSHLEKLRTLNLLYSGAVADSSALQVLSRIPTLRSLDLEISLKGLGDTELDLDDAFRTLREINVLGRVKDIARFFATAGEFDSLEELHLDLADPCTLSLWQKSLPEILKKMPSSLRHISLHYPHNISPATTSILDMIKPFFAFSDIVHFEVEMEQLIPHIFDDDLRACSAAWPKLSSSASGTPPSLSPSKAAHTCHRNAELLPSTRSPSSPHGAHCSATCSSPLST